MLTGEKEMGYSLGSAELHPVKRKLTNRVRTIGKNFVNFRESDTPFIYEFYR